MNAPPWCAATSWALTLKGKLAAVAASKTRPALFAGGCANLLAHSGSHQGVVEILPQQRIRFADSLAACGIGGLPTRLAAEPRRSSARRRSEPRAAPLPNPPR